MCFRRYSALIHEHVRCVMRTGKFKPLIQSFAQVTAAFCLVSIWQCHVDDEMCLPLPSDYIKPVQDFVQDIKPVQCFI